MSEYLERCFKSYPNKAAAIAGAIKQIDAIRRGEHVELGSSAKQRIATKCWRDNAWIALNSPPLPDHIYDQRETERLEQIRLSNEKGHDYSSAALDYGKGKYQGD